MLEKIIHDAKDVWFLQVHALNNKKYLRKGREGGREEEGGKKKDYIQIIGHLGIK